MTSFNRKCKIFICFKVSLQLEKMHLRKNMFLKTPNHLSVDAADLRMSVMVSLPGYTYFVFTHTQSCCVIQGHYPCSILLAFRGVVCTSQWSGLRVSQAPLHQLQAFAHKWVGLGPSLYPVKGSPQLQSHRIITILRVCLGSRCLCLLIFL